jgi:hypothetical protein
MAGLWIEFLALVQFISIPESTGFHAKLRKSAAMDVKLKLIKYLAFSGMGTLTSSSHSIDFFFVILLARDSADTADSCVLQRFSHWVTLPIHLL